MLIDKRSDVRAETISAGARRLIERRTRPRRQTGRAAGSIREGDAKEENLLRVSGWQRGEDAPLRRQGSGLRRAAADAAAGEQHTHTTLPRMGTGTVRHTTHA